MEYIEAKVYNDGSHYVGIPKKDTKERRGLRKKESLAYIDEKGKLASYDDEISCVTTEKGRVLQEIEFKGNTMVAVKRKKTALKKVSRREVFERVYKENCTVNKGRLKEEAIKALKPYFKKESEAIYYAEENIKRKIKNMSVRRIRCMRKASLQSWDYFVTITYDDKKHTEESFRKKLTNTLSHLSSRKGWKYIGVWERGEGTNRLHFHGIFHIPEGTMKGEFESVNGYDIKERRKRVTYQNTYFSEQFGRNDFKEIERKSDVTEGINYILKYIEKSGERIVYSRRLPTFFYTDILEEDIATEYGEYDNVKLVLFDDFRCIREGEIIGVVSRETITKLRYAY